MDKSSFMKEKNKKIIIAVVSLVIMIFAVSSILIVNHNLIVNNNTNNTNNNSNSTNNNQNTANSILDGKNIINDGESDNVSMPIYIENGKYYLYDTYNNTIYNLSIERTLTVKNEAITRILYESINGEVLIFKVDSVKEKGNNNNYEGKKIIYIKNKRISFDEIFDEQEKDDIIVYNFYDTTDSNGNMIVNKKNNQIIMSDSSTGRYAYTYCDFDKKQIVKRDFNKTLDDSITLSIITYDYNGKEIDKKEKKYEKYIGSSFYEQVVVAVINNKFYYVDSDLSEHELVLDSSFNTKNMFIASCNNDVCASLNEDELMNTVTIKNFDNDIVYRYNLATYKLDKVK